MEYTVIIPTYNHCDDLLKPCVESIIRHTTGDANLSVIIVANGCTDNTKKYLEELDYRHFAGNPDERTSFDLHVIWEDKPIGYTVAVNRGIKKSIELNSDYTILMNNDVVLMNYAANNKWLDILTKPFDEPNVGMVGTSKIIDPITKSTFIIFYMAVIKTSIFGQIGLLDEAFNPGYGEDIDFAIRLQRAGYSIKRVPSEGVGYDYAELFPLYHGAEKTMHDEKSNIKEVFGLSWDEVITRNNQILKERYADIEITLGANNTQTVTNNETHRNINQNYLTNAFLFSIIIPTTGNYRNKLDICLNTLLDVTDNANIQIIVVANGVTNETKIYLDDFIEQSEANIMSIYEENAIGFPKAINKGIKAATGSYIILLNDDVVFIDQPKNEWLDILAKPFDNDNSVGITGLKKLGSSFSKSEYLMFFLTMISREVINKIGNLDEDFSPAFVEDEEYCLRAEKAGYKIIEVGTDTPDNSRMVQVYHKSGATLNDFDEKRKIVKRNRYNLLDKYYPNDLVNIVVPTYDRHEELRRALLSIEMQTYDKIKVWICADGHDDEVMKITKEFNELSEHKIYTYLALPEHEGLIGSKPRMMGIDATEPTGVVCFLDDDNVIHPTYVEKLFNAIRSDGNYQSNEVYIPETNIISYCQIDHSHFNVIPNEQHKEGVFDVGYVDTLNVMVNSYVAKQCKEKWQHVAGQLITHDFDFISECAKYGKSVYVKEILADHCMSLGKVGGQNIPKPPKRGKVYDCFLFFNEFDVLDIRLNELYDYVDRFVLVEARFTHQGQPKPLYFDENKQRFARFLDKIEHIVVDEMCSLDDPFVSEQRHKQYFKENHLGYIRERYQRDKMREAWKECADNDIIIISDADEIPSHTAVANYDVSMGYCTLAQRLFYYKLNCEINVVWPKARIMPYSYIKDKYPSDVRFEEDYTTQQLIPNGGWHFSYLYADAAGVIEKMKSFCHDELVTPERTDVTRVQEIIDNAQDIYGRNHPMGYIELDENYPEYILSNRNIFVNKNLIKPVMDLEKYDPYTYDEIFVTNLYNVLKEDIEGSIVFDIGGHAGFFAIKCVQLGAKEVYTFEPESNNYKYLMEFIKKYPQIKPYKQAVLDGSMKSIHITNEKTASTIWGADTDEEVECVSMESAVKSLGPINDRLVLKLDCEGSEFEIIFNTPKEIIQKFDSIFIEIHQLMNPNYLGKREELKNYIVSLGFDEVPQLLVTGTWFPDGSFIPGENNVFKYKRRASVAKIKREDVTRDLLNKLDWFIFSEIYTDNVYHMEAYDLKNSTVIDVGANYGFFSLRALELGAKNAYCFEPEGANYKQLVELTADFPEIKTFKLAVSDGAVGEIHMHSDRVASNIWGKEDGEAVKCISFVEAMSHIDPTDKNLILKLDCEGSEYEILLHTPPEIIQKFGYIYLEIHDEMNPNFMHKSGMLVDYLKFIGFDIISTGPQWGVWYPDGSFKAAPIYVHKLKQMRRPSDKLTEKSKVYDCFMFNDELDILDVRLAELNDVVDYFVIVESPETHSGKPKPLYFKENEQRYAKYLHKIRHFEYTYPVPTDNAWHRESHQRDACVLGLYDCKDYDIIISGDADEIPKKEVIQNYDPQRGVVGVETKYYFYFLNCERQDKGTTHLRILPYYILKPQSFCFFRYKDYPLITNGGWHFSFIGDVNQIKKKIESYAHQEYNTEHFTNTERLTKMINNGEDILEKGMQFKFVEIDETFPKYIIEHKNDFIEKNSIKTQPRPKVYDCFLFYNELDLLELRLNELNDVVDKFVLVESNITFTGMLKPYYYDNNKGKFSAFADKIIHIKVDDTPKYNSPWDNETYQRNAIYRGLQGCDDNDIILISDIDEIPAVSVIAKYEPANEICAVEQKLTYYFFNCLSNELWYSLRIGTWANFKKTTANTARNDIYRPLITDGGWHFSYIGNVEHVIKKIESFSHQEYNNDYIKNADRLRDKMLNGEDIFDRTMKFTFIDLDDTFPNYLLKNEDRYISLGYIKKKRIKP